MNIGKSSPVLFGTIGTLDPNYEELRSFDAELDAIGTIHHIERFDGGHQWPPTELSTRAVEWLDLQAMRRGLKPRDQPWIDSLYAAWLARASRADSTGDAPVAARQYRFVRADFDGLTDVSVAAQRLAMLERDARVRRTAAAEASIGARDYQLGSALVAFAGELKGVPSPPPIDQARKRLELDGLRRQAERTDDSTASIAARRALERIFIHLSFYAPREFFDDKRYAHAAYRAADRASHQAGRRWRMLLARPRASSAGRQGERAGGAGVRGGKQTGGRRRPSRATRCWRLCARIHVTRRSLGA